MIQKKKLLIILTMILGLNSCIFNPKISLFTDSQLTIHQEAVNDLIHQTKRIQYQQYSYHAPIKISSNTDFSFLGFLGSGTKDDPYIIEDLVIKDSTEDLIIISYTTTYFIIRNCILNNTRGWGIYFYNVVHGSITNNTITGVGADGIGLYFSSENIIANNSIYKNGLNGIRLEAYSDNNSIVNNTLINNYEGGIFIGNSYNNTVIANSISKHIIGLYITGEVDETIRGSDYNIISYNSVFLNNEGIIMVSYSSHNLIVNNSIFANDNYGLILEASSNNLVTWNNFIDNSLLTTSQARDDGSENVFTLNYWHDQNNPDENNDGIVDYTYLVDGLANNEDHFPLVNPILNAPSWFEIDKSGLSSTFLANDIFLIGFFCMICTVIALWTYIFLSKMK